jgi:hypothetical protein
VLEGPGAWTERGLVGPLPEKAAREVLHRSWGNVDSVDLPQMLPEPPSARTMWAIVAVMALMLVTITTLAVLSPRTEPGDLQAEFTAGRGGMWAAFDVPEPALVYLVGQREGTLWPVLYSQGAADKALYATGDGSYRVFVPGEGVLLLVTEQPLPLPSLEAALQGAQSGAKPLESLATELAQQGRIRWSLR